MTTDVSSIIADQQAFALEAVASANAFLQQLQTLASSPFYVQSNAVPASPVTFDSAAARALLLSLFPADLASQSITATAPSFTAGTVSALETVPIPDFGKESPSLDMPTVPSATLPNAPAAPTIADPQLPTSPSVTIPVSPVLATITFPEPPAITIPAFSASSPLDDLLVPTNNFAFNEVAYSSALLDSLNAKLLDNMENGGYGIEVTDEIALFNRARDREVEMMLSKVDDAGRTMAIRGFPLPPGELSIHVDRAYQDMQDKVSDVSRDITLQRNKLYVENRQFTIAQSKEVEQILIGYHNSVMERALNAAKATLEAAIRIYDAQVSRFNARLDAYKTESSVFEARVRAALVQVDMYRTQMEGKRIESDIQRSRVEVYNAQIAGVNAVVGVYRTQMEAAQIQAGIERLRIESFQSLVQAYTAQVQAKVAEFNMYEAGVRGQVARVSAFESEVRAYSATVEGAKAKSDVLIARLRAEIESANQRVETYRTQVNAYSTDVTAQAQVVDANVRTYGAQVQGAAAQANAISDALRLEVTSNDLEFRRNVANAEIAIKDATLMLEALVASAGLREKAAIAGSGYYQALIGGAVNSINTLSALVTSA